MWDEKNVKDYCIFSNIWRTYRVREPNWTFSTYFYAELNWKRWYVKIWNTKEEAEKRCIFNSVSRLYITKDGETLKEIKWLSKPIEKDLIVFEYIKWKDEGLFFL